MARSMLARVLCLRGFLPERADREARDSVEAVPEHELSFCYVTYFVVVRWARTSSRLGTLPPCCELAIQRLSKVAMRLEPAVGFQVVARLLEGMPLLVARGAFERGMAVLHEAFDTCRRTGWRASYPEFMGALAEALGGSGRFGEALDAVNDAVAGAGQGAEGQVWYVPELLRIRGDLLLRQDAPGAATAAEDCFAQSEEMAREQGALLWELRVALSRARLKLTPGAPHRGTGYPATGLSPVYRRI